VGRRPHVLAEVDLAICESELRVLLGFLGTTSGVGEEVQVKLYSIEGIDRFDLLLLAVGRHVLNETLLLYSPILRQPYQLNT